MDEIKIKQTFRILYNFVMHHQHPQFTVEYFGDVLDEMKELHSADRYNILLECLLAGVYDYLAKQAKKEKEEAEK